MRSRNPDEMHLEDLFTIIHPKYWLVGFNTFISQFPYLLSSERIYLKKSNKCIHLVVVVLDKDRLWALGMPLTTATVITFPVCGVLSNTSCPHYQTINYLFLGNKSDV